MKKPQMQLNPNGTERYAVPASAHLAYETMLTRKGKRNMVNMKPFRTKVQQAVARKDAKMTVGGFWASDAPVTYH